MYISKKKRKESKEKKNITKIKQTKVPPIYAHAHLHPESQSLSPLAIGSSIPSFFILNQTISIIYIYVTRLRA